MRNADYIKQYLSDMARIAADLPHEDIDAAIELLFDAWKRDATVFIAGNGGSASTASHFACDLAKWTWSEGKRRFRALSLNDNMPLYSALVNDEGPGSVYAEQLDKIRKLLGVHQPAPTSEEQPQDCQHDEPCSQRCPNCNCGTMWAIDVSPRPRLSEILQAPLLVPT